MTKDNTNSFPRPPKAKFQCPISTYILWHHNLIYQSCPVCAEQRNMNTCNNCPLRGEVDKKLHKDVKEYKPKKATEEVERKSKEPIPNIGKTYSSE